METFPERGAVVNEQQLAECDEQDARERERFAVGSLVYLRTTSITRGYAGPLVGDLVPRTEHARELFETPSGWIWQQPVGASVRRPLLFEVTAIKPGCPLDCGSEAGPGYWGARYTLVCVEDDAFTPVSPVPAARLVLLDDIPASVPAAG